MNNLVDDALHEGTVRGLKIAIQMANLERSQSVGSGDKLDYLLTSLKELVKEMEHKDGTE